MALDNNEVVLRILLSAVVGLLFGADRERAHKPAGVRTYILVCLSSCVISLASAYGYVGVAAAYPATVVQVHTDPARLMVGVLTGIGFLGAGIIWRTPKGDVSGVTTAAGIFMVAALGLCCGLGLYLLIAVAGPIALAVLISERIRRRRALKRKQARETQAQADQAAADEMENIAEK